MPASRLLGQSPYPTTLRRLPSCKEPQMLVWTRQRRSVAPGLGAIHHAAFLRIEGKQRALGRGKTRWSKATVANVRHFAMAQVIVTVIFRQHDDVKDGAQFITRHPQQHLRLG